MKIFSDAVEAIGGLFSSILQARTSSGILFRDSSGLTRIQLADDGRLIHYADDNAGGTNDHFVQVVNQPASVTRLQTITVDVVSSTAVVNIYNTYVDIGLARNGNAAVFGWATGRITWQNVNAVAAANILSYDIASNSSGTTTVTVTAINNGVRFTFGGGDFLNTLDRNSVIVQIMGHDALRPSVTITIS